MEHLAEAPAHLAHRPSQPVQLGRHRAQLDGAEITGSETVRRADQAAIQDKMPRYAMLEDKDYGLLQVTTRSGPAGQTRVGITHFIMPSTTTAKPKCAKCMPQKEPAIRRFAFTRRPARWPHARAF